MWGSRAYVLKLVEDVRASYWFIPTAMALCAAVASELTQWIDHHRDVVPAILPGTFLDTTVDGARSTLAVIAQSVIGVTGVMFSMTLVAVSFASGNFGPRLIGNFMRDRGNQLSLGVLIATFVYALLILNAVQGGVEGGAEPFVPQYSMLLALLMTFVSVITLIYFVHHIPETINVSNITAGLGWRLSQSVRDFIDSRLDAADDAPPDVPAPVGDLAATVTLGGSGYIQQLDLARLSQTARDHGCVLRIQVAIGDFVTPRQVVCHINTHSEPDEDTADAVRTCFALGPVQTEAQNPVFVADQLVEMTARALSPGMNDPFTAINCLNWLHVGLADALAYRGGLRPGVVGDVHYDQLDFERLVKSSLAAALPYCQEDELVAAHLETVIDDLEGSARDDADRACLTALHARLRA